MAGLVLGDPEVGRGLPVVPALDVRELQGGPQRGGHGRDDVVGPGRDRGPVHPLLQTGPVLVRVDARAVLLAQPPHGLAVREPGHPGAHRALPGVVRARVLPHVAEDLAGHQVGGGLVVQHPVGLAVHERGEPVVELAESRRLTACQPLLHLAVPAGWRVFGHATPDPVPSALFPSSHRM